ncbi:MAG: hypothetical protein IPO65_15690, partial [Saprospiraceae bacterium]|nr:hypothetical protein [Saprospiraceae bacterium]
MKKNDELPNRCQSQPPTPPVVTKTTVEESPVQIDESPIEIEKPAKEDVPVSKPKTEPSKPNTPTKTGAGTVSPNRHKQ